MDKEYKNLTIENLLKTGLFTKEQKHEIEQGIRENLNVSLYAHPCFDKDQMYQIRNGLENELDASIYAYPEYNDGQMEEIKWGIAQDLDYTKYLDSSLSRSEMRKIREKLFNKELKKTRKAQGMLFCF